MLDHIAKLSLITVFCSSSMDNDNNNDRLTVSDNDTNDVDYV